MVKSKHKNSSKNAAAKRAHACSGDDKKKGGKFRRQNQGGGPVSANGIMQCYENAIHTDSVALRHIPFAVKALDEEPCSKTRRGKLKKLRKQTKTVVITRTNIGDIGSHHHQNPHSSEVTIQALYVRPLLVLDLNGILCKRIRYNRLSVTERERINFRSSVGHIAGTPVVAREDLQPMLSYLDANFTLAVWTSARIATARGLISLLFPPDIANRLLFVWGQDRCDATRPNDTRANDLDGAIDKASNEPDGGEEDCKPNVEDSFDVIFEKNLGKVWRDYPCFDSTNTLLIDDSPEKARKWIENTLHPPPIDGIAAKEPGGESADLSNAIKQRIFFQQLVAHFTSEGGEADDRDLCSNMAVESADNQRERKAQASKKLHEFLALDNHMGWRGPL